MRRNLNSTADTANTTFLVEPVRPGLLHAALVSMMRGEPVERFYSFEHQALDPQTAQRHPLRILLAEDNIINQKVALRLLERMGYRADVAATGAEVLDALHRQPYDVVLMDVQMPDMDGIEATGHIRATWPKAQQPYIIAMTAHVMEGYRQWCLDAGMDDYLGKPVQIDALAAKLRQAPGSREPHITNPADTTAPQPVPSAPAPALDAATFEQFCNTMGREAEGLACELITIFLNDTPKKLALLHQAIADEDTDTLIRIAHTLKSSSAQLGALPFSALCRELEMHGHAGTLSAATDALAAVEAEYVRVQVEMQDAIAHDCANLQTPGHSMI
jgi:CheY-like chemotaxis protein/HPt (histidine-containing phosphotransfer) domain-containing protein